MLSEQDLCLRGELTRAIAELGHAPSAEDLARRCNCTPGDVEHSLRQLHAAHCLALHPDRTEPWAVHPFALSPASCWVSAGDRGWWANCLYCGMGIVAALDLDAEIHTRFGGEAEPLVVSIAGGRVGDGEILFHLSTPVRHWWNNVIHACATFQPFRTEAEVEAWCARHALPRGTVMTTAELWDFAKDWYGDYLRKPWRKRSLLETEAIFAKHRLTGDFWRLT